MNNKLILKTLGIKCLPEEVLKDRTSVKGKMFPKKDERRVMRPTGGWERFCRH